MDIYIWFICSMDQVHMVDATSVDNSVEAPTLQVPRCVLSTAKISRKT